MDQSDIYKTITGPAEGEYSEKRSKFLAFAHPVHSVDEIKELVESYQKKYYDARHCCYAYMLGPERKEFRANDNGEPSGTAGKPILGQINSHELTNVLIVVVRYFGGIKLGTSGLIVAYRQAALEAIQAATIIEKTIDEEVSFLFEYPFMNSVMRIVKECRLTVVSQRQELDCTLILSVRLSQIEPVKERFSKLDFVRFEEYVEAEVGE